MVVSAAVTTFGAWVRLCCKVGNTALPLGRKGTRAAQAASPSPVQTWRFPATRPGGYSLPGLTGKAVVRGAKVGHVHRPVRGPVPGGSLVAGWRGHPRYAPEPQVIP